MSDLTQWNSCHSFLQGLSCNQKLSLNLIFLFWRKAWMVIFICLQLLQVLHKTGNFQFLMLWHCFYSAPSPLSKSHLQDLTDWNDHFRLPNMCNPPILPLCKENWGTPKEIKIDKKKTILVVVLKVIPLRNIYLRH